MMPNRGDVNRGDAQLTPLRPLQVKNPATGKLLATMPLMKAEETRAAIASADSVFPQWRGQTAKYRAAVLRRWGWPAAARASAAPVPACATSHAGQGVQAWGKARHRPPVPACAMDGDGWMACVYWRWQLH